MSKSYSELTQSFERRSIDPSIFRHGDHVGVAYEMLCKYDFMDATMKYGECLNMIATKAGAAKKFNTTITVAFMSLIAERMKKSEHTGYEDFITQNQDLLSKDVLKQWYSAERLKSDLARSVFLMPDACNESRANEASTSALGATAG
ncbi:hypothetical protein [Pelagibius sp. Alg239-R121]|uniref:hypothetical protein n=1 Tax=Pelagibius sp. Alg239-R121 TaxID=2993448 RepID=UPI0024A6A559|nr:hypothetical protein [Pelagibius sp. Alg239-R121]